ncbi:hypothetical protein AMECASPLE_033877 [Ameca splendens]|uniref:Uncharacterized protein n=1 Tax=Ameca splendens TaxID=208324 RepID=A0ABV0XVV9_9TELE
MVGDPVPGSVPEGSQDKLHPSLVPVSEEFVDELSPLPFPVPEGCDDTPSPPAVPRWLHHRSPRPHRRSQRFPQRASELHHGFSWSCRRPSDQQTLLRSPGFQRSPHHVSELHRGFSWSRRWPSDHRLLRRRPADGLFLRHRLADRLLLRRSYDHLLIGGSAGDVHLNAGSAGDGLWAVCLNSFVTGKSLLLTLSCKSNFTMSSSLPAFAPSFAAF